MQDTHTCKQHTYTCTDARAHTGQMEQARQGQVHVHLIRMLGFLTPAMAPQSLRLGFELLIRAVLLFCRLPSLSLTLIKITSVYIYANTWQAADAPFSTLCSNKRQKKTTTNKTKRGGRANLEPEHIWVYSHWPDPDVGRRAQQAKTHLDTSCSKTMGKREHSTPPCARLSILHSVWISFALSLRLNSEESRELNRVWWLRLPTNSTHQISLSMG